MKEESNIRGVADDRRANTMTIAYGPDPVAIEHAIKLHRGRARHRHQSQPPRPFWGISAQAEAEITQHIDAMMR